MSKPTLLELADNYAKEYFMGRGEDARKRFQAAVITSETEAHNAVLNERKVCESIARSYGPSRPVVSQYPSQIVLGRWEGEQAASSNIANAIAARGAK